MCCSNVSSYSANQVGISVKGIREIMNRFFKLMSDVAVLIVAVECIILIAIALLICNVMVAEVVLQWWYQ